MPRRTSRPRPKKSEDNVPTVKGFINALEVSLNRVTSAPGNAYEEAKSDISEGIDDIQTSINEGVDNLGEEVGEALKKGAIYLGGIVVGGLLVYYIGKRYIDKKVF